MTSEIHEIDMADGSTVRAEIEFETGHVLRIIDGNGSATVEDIQAIVDKWERPPYQQDKVG